MERGVGRQKSAVFAKMLRLMWRPELATMAAFEPARQLYAACGFTIANRSAIT